MRVATPTTNFLAETLQRKQIHGNGSQQKKKKCDLVDAVSNIVSVIHYKSAKNFAEEKSG